jgi:predicted transcriptional regulator
MATSQNLTVRLDQQTVRKAKVAAARRGTSISRLVAQAIEDLAREEDAYEAAMNEALADLDRGLPLGGPPYLSRRETHDR